MSLFGTKSITTYSSVVYNMAGPEADRVNYLKTTIVGAIINSVPSIAESLTNAYLSGPGTHLRSFVKWAQNHGYNTLIGLNGSDIILSQKIDHTALAASIHPSDPNQTAVIEACSIGRADFTQWADQYVALHYPALLGSAYRADFDSATDTVTITFTGGATASFTAADLDPNSYYLYANYSLVTGSVTGPLVTGTVVSLGSLAMMPATAGWTMDSSTDTPQTMALDTAIRTQVTYSNSTPATDHTVTTTTHPSYEDSTSVWEKVTYQGTTVTPNALTSLRQVMTQTVTGTKATATSATTTTEMLTGGVIRTTVITVSTDSLVMVGTCRIDTQTLTGRSWTSPLVLIYRKNSGNADMDALFLPPKAGGEFFPIVPFRLNGRFVDEAVDGSLYGQAKKAIKKSVNGKFDKINRDIANNPEIGNITSVFGVYGVSLNVQENACRQYIYEFFLDVMQGQDLTGAEYLAWQVAANAATASKAIWQTWFDAQGDESAPLFGTAEPAQPYIPPAPLTYISVKTTRPGINYGVTVSWTGALQTTGEGLLKPGAKNNELWFEAIGGEGIRLNWQVDKNSWRSLEVYGLMHSYSYWAQHYVFVTAHEALADSAESGFIVPLQQEIYRRVGLVNATQMSTASCFLVFTCGQTHKRRWYESGLFKILIIVIVIIIVVVVSVLTMGAATPGLLGTAGAVGSAIGLTGTVAVIAGVIINTLAAMILTMIITKAATAAFGEKIGSIVGVIASFYAVNLGSAIMSGVSVSMSAMSVITNLMKLTMAVGDGIAGYMQAAAKETLGKIEDISTAYDKESAAIKTQSEAFLGSDNGIIDPMSMTDSRSMPSAGLVSVFDTSSTSVSIETADVFLSRTLLTGSELADLSMEMISKFASITLSTNLPV